ncbi:ABC transporter ATP-binding protein [Oceanobacillus damuensis]|uniref:ABC transporter ATP-binding protein n=1 Tax=Oceanobacillus damuensis TaxID=937928 RepID=UPI00082EF4DC|nr:ABC transporter ATP-binding protein [Oceanobacillus damuensis]
MMNRLLHLENLNVKDTHNHELVKGVSLDLYEHEFVGIVGESGSGKTLSVKAALHLLPNDLGVTFEDSEVLGKSIIDLSDHEKRRLIGSGIGFVPQNTVAFLHPMIKIKHQIGDAFIYHTKANKKEALQKAEELLVKVGIKEPKRVLHSYPVQLSGGMKQRVNIAMALMTDPKVIIADEPTTALDTVVQKQVMQLFNDLYTNDGVSILFISHDLKIVKRFCNRIYVMHEGKVVESGYTSEVFADPTHSYTKKLLRLIPSLKSGRTRRLG